VKIPDLEESSLAGTHGASRGEIFRRMLQHPRYLFRPWIPIVKAVEGEVFAHQRLVPPVLNIACGDGIFAWATYGRPLDVGIDLDPAVFAEARRLRVYRHLAVADARALPFRSGSFPTVTSVCAIEHMDGLPTVLREVSRVLAPGGTLYFTVPSDQFGDLVLGSRIWRALGCSTRAAAYGARKNARSHHVNILGAAAWREALQAESLEVVTTVYLLSRGVMAVWSLFTSSPFKLLFLPFRLVRDRDWPWVQRLLRRLLLSTIGPILERADGVDRAAGGYLFVVARKTRL
jgi:SAM-dependent methyltransferase